jgi:hypothetical protein
MRFVPFSPEPTIPGLYRSIPAVRTGMCELIHVQAMTDSSHGRQVC